MGTLHSATGAAVAVLLTMGCSSDSPAASWTSADSAGITILRGPAPDIPLGVQASEPTVVVHEANDAPLFRIGEITARTDGGFFVVDGGNQRVLSFDPSGTLLSSAGSQGDGPGEFQAPMTLVHRGDSVFVYDRRHRRVTVFTQDLQYARDQTLTAPEGFNPPQFEGILGNGAWVGREATPLGGLPASGILRVPVRFLTLPPAAPDVLASGQGSERWVSIISEGGEVISANVIAYDFFDNTYAAFGSELFAVGDSDDWTLDVHGPDGSLTRRMVVERPLVPFGSAGIDRFLATRPEATPQELRDLRESLEKMDLPETMPAFSDLLVDDLGRVWARSASLDRNGAYEWIVFGEGGALGTVTTHPRFALKAVANGTLYGVFRDDFDVESLHTYTLEESD